MKISLKNSEFFDYLYEEKNLYNFQRPLLKIKHEILYKIYKNKYY